MKWYKQHRERIVRAVLAAAFWAMFGWCAHAMVTQWIDALGDDEQTTGNATVEVVGIDFPVEAER